MKSNKFVRGIFGLILSCFVIVGITSCEPPVPGTNYGETSIYGTWENNAGGWHSEYVVSENYINDKSMGVLYNVVSATRVTTSDGYTLVFCQVAEGSGTEYTPAGRFYAVAIKLDNGILKISCPLDYNSVYESVEKLEEIYTSSYKFAGSGNWETVCTKMGEAVSVTEKTCSATKVTFTKTKVSLFEMGVDGFHEDSDTIFTPVRDKTKENGDVKLYLYDTSSRNNVMDTLYVEIKKNESGDLAVYYFLYDEESEEDTGEPNYYEYYWEYDIFPTVTDDQLSQILALYE